MTSRQKRRKYQWQFLSDFKNWCYTRSLCTENEKSKLISRLSNFTNPFIPPCDDQVSDVDDLFWFRQQAPCSFGKIFCKTVCQIQMPYMDIIRTVHYNLSVPYPFPQYVSFTPSYLLSLPGTPEHRNYGIRNTGTLWNTICTIININLV